MKWNENKMIPPTYNPLIPWIHFYSISFHKNKLIPFASKNSIAVHLFILLTPFAPFINFTFIEFFKSFKFMDWLNGMKANGSKINYKVAGLVSPSFNQFIFYLPAELQSINKRKAMRVNGRNHITHSILASTSLHCFPLCSNHSVSFRKFLQHCRLFIHFIQLRFIPFMNCTSCFRNLKYNSMHKPYAIKVMKR